MEDPLMLLCDIGNTSYHFYEDGKDYKEKVSDFDSSSLAQNVYYISVNQDLQERLSHLDNWIDLRPLIDWENYYETMGIDRAVACEAVENGIIIDAGSAVTVDIVKDGLFRGGFIIPGVNAMQSAYANISPRLDYSFNFDLDLDKMPKNSRDAVSYGYLRLLYGEVERHEGKLYITGGDAQKIARLFKDAIVDELLIFKGMKKLIQKAGLC